MQISLTPDVAMRVLRYVLVRYRLLAGKSQDEAAEHLGLKQPSIAGFEAGRTAPTPPNLFSLLVFYRRPEQYDRLRAVRDVAARRDRKEPASIGLLSDIELRLGLEYFAVSAETYMPYLVDGLLQTPPYARWLLENSSQQLGLSVDERLQLRMDRQAVIHREPSADLPPLNLRMLIQESALRRPIGGREVLRGQLTHLIKQAKRPNIEILVVPDSVIYHRAMRGQLTVLAFDDDLKVAHAEDFQAAHYYDSPGALDNAARLLTELHGLAHDQRESVRLITTIREELGSP